MARATSEDAGGTTRRAAELSTALFAAFWGLSLRAWQAHTASRWIHMEDEPHMQWAGRGQVGRKRAGDKEMRRSLGDATARADGMTSHGHHAGDHDGRWQRGEGAARIYHDIPDRWG